MVVGFPFGISFSGQRDGDMLGSYVAFPGALVAVEGDKVPGATDGITDGTTVGLCVSGEVVGLCVRGEVVGLCVSGEVVGLGVSGEVVGMGVSGEVVGVTGWSDRVPLVGAVLVRSVLDDVGLLVGRPGRVTFKTNQAYL